MLSARHHRRRYPQRIAQDGRIARVIGYLEDHGFTSYEALMIPFHLWFAAILLYTPIGDVNASPVYGKLTDIAPIWAWAVLMLVFAAAVGDGVLFGRWTSARLGYVAMAAWWFSIGGLIYAAADTLLTPSVYFILGISCIYRQAVIAVDAYGRG